MNVVHNQELGARNWDKNKAYKPFRNTFLSLRLLHICFDRRPLLAPSRTWCPQQSCLHSPSWRISSCRSSRQQSWGRIDMYGYASSILKRCQKWSIAYLQVSWSSGALLFTLPSHLISMGLWHIFTVSFRASWLNVIWHFFSKTSSHTWNAYKDRRM